MPTPPESSSPTDPTYQAAEQGSVGTTGTPDGRKRPAMIVLLVLAVLILIGALVAIVVLGPRVWQDVSSRLDAETGGEPEAGESVEPGAGGEGGEGGEEGEASSDGSPALDADRLRSEDWYGEFEADGTVDYRMNGVEATMRFVDRWDHQDCSGIGRTDVGRAAFDDGGCEYGIEMAMEHDSGMFWVAQRILAFDDAAAAESAASKVPSGAELFADVAFTHPQLNDGYGVGNIRSFGRCVVVGAVALDAEAVADLGADDQDQLFDQATKVLTFTVVEPVNAHRFGAYEQTCG